MTERAKEVLYAYMDVEKDLSQPKILIHTFKELINQLTLPRGGYDWEDEQGMMYNHGYDDCLKDIDYIIDELEAL